MQTLYHTLEFASYDEARAKNAGGYLAASYGCHVSPITREEAGRIIALGNVGRQDGAHVEYHHANGYCHDCGAKVGGRKRFCPDCRNARRSESSVRCQALRRAREEW